MLIPNADHRVWIQGYGLVWGRKDEKECSLPENVGPRALTNIKLAWTDYENDAGIKPDFDLLLRNYTLEFPDDRVRIAKPRGAQPLPRGPLSLE